MEKHFVVGFAFYKNYCVFVEKQRPEFQKGLLNGVGGKVEEGETSSNCMVREFYEEACTVVPLSSWVMLGTVMLPPIDKAIIDVYCGALTTKNFYEILLFSKYVEDAEKVITLDMKNELYKYNEAKKLYGDVFDLALESYKTYNGSLEGVNFGTCKHSSRINK